jgi:hypothetical protein
MKLYKPRYLGDRVYASFDGYHICLHVGSHENAPVVKLEDEVMEQLAAYVEDVKSHVEECAQEQTRKQETRDWRPL